MPGWKGKTLWIGFENFRWKKEGICEREESLAESSKAHDGFVSEKHFWIKENVGGMVVLKDALEKGFIDSGGVDNLTKT